MTPRHWSFSSLSLYEQCPQRWFLKYKRGLADPRGPALERGIQVHEILEHALREGASKPVGQGEWLDRKVEEYRELPVLRVEQAIHLDEKWERVEAVEGHYVPPGTYVTGKLDVLAAKPPKSVKKFSKGAGFFADWKTGKVYEDKNRDQGHLYATMLASLTGILRWLFELIYIDHEYIDRVEYQFDDPEGETLEAAQQSWRERADKMRKAKRFPKQPSPLCGWCPYHESKGGPCDGKRDP